MSEAVLQVALVAVLATSSTLALVFLYVAIRERSRAMWIFCVSWTLYALRFVVAILLEIAPHPALFALNQLLTVFSSFGLFLAFDLWMDTALPRSLAMVPALLVSGWIVAGSLLQTSFVALTLPVFVYSGLVFLWAGIALVRRRQEQVAANAIVGIALIVWGLHKLDYPFLRNVAAFAPWGFLIGALAATVVGIGTVLIFFERSAERLSRTLRDREILIREVHHRVKNNLAIVSALLGFQSDRFAGEGVQNAFLSVQNRLSTIGLVHEQLLETEELGTVNIAPYLQTLVDRLSQTLHSEDLQVTITRSFIPLEVDMELAVPCGLIVNELVSNAHEHAFKGQTSGSILVSLQMIESEVELRVDDDGVWAGEASTTGSGLWLVDALAQQINGKVHRVQENGTSVSIRFALPEPRAAVLT